MVDVGVVVGVVGVVGVVDVGVVVGVVDVGVVVGVVDVIDVIEVVGVGVVVGIVGLGRAVGAVEGDCGADAVAVGGTAAETAPMVVTVPLSPHLVLAGANMALPE